jgi:hypothetical protein
MQSEAREPSDQDAIPPTLIQEQPASNPCRSHGNHLVGKAAHAADGAALLARIERMVQELSAGRVVPDDEIRQHASDCTQLMERAYARFLEHRLPSDREEAMLWMHGRDEANKALSPEFKAARELQIQAAIAQGTTWCYFIDQGDAARLRLAGGRG